jgi:hypothetical protein
MSGCTTRYSLSFFVQFGFLLKIQHLVSVGNINAEPWKAC